MSAVSTDQMPLYVRWRQRVGWWVRIGSTRAAAAAPTKKPNLEEEATVDVSPQSAEPTNTAESDSDSDTE